MVDDLRHINCAHNPTLYRMPVVFEHVTPHPLYPYEPYKVVHNVSVCDSTHDLLPRLFVFAHGFQGNNLDMKIVKNHL